MDNTSPPLLSVQLKERTLWADGDSSYKPDMVTDLIASGSIKGQIYVTELDDMINQYNAMVPVDSRIKIKTDINKLDHKWNIPLKYTDMSVVEYVNNQFEQHYKKHIWGDNEKADRRKRMVQELVLYHKYGLLDVLRTIIYIINTLTEKQVVWGVGRGSSVSSYVLYLIGVHDVDSFVYDLDIADFLHST